MERKPIIYGETELCLVDGRWCLTNNCYGASPEEMFGKPTRSVVADASASYSMYYDDFCYDVLMFRVKGKCLSQGTGTCHKGTNAEWDNGQAPVTRNIKTPQWDIQSKTWERNN